MFAHPCRGWSTKSKKPSIWKTGQGIDNKGDPSKLWLKVKVQCPPNTLYFISYFDKGRAGSRKNKVGCKMLSSKV